LYYDNTYKKARKNGGIEGKRNKSLNLNNNLEKVMGVAGRLEGELDRVRKGREGNNNQVNNE
jgi:hypothetical protein